MLDARQGKVLDDKISKFINRCIIIKKYNKDNVVISKSEYITVEVKAPIIVGYSRTIWDIGIVNSSNNGVNSSFCNAYYSSLTDDVIRIHIRYYGASEARIDVRVRMVYILDELKVL